MPFQVGSVAVHDDGQHTGSAKRGVASGVGSLDALGHTTPAEMILAELLANKNIASGYAGLDASTLLTLAQQQLNFKIGTFSRDTSLASGTQAVTGVGFQPRAVFFLAGVAAGDVNVSTGFDDGTNPCCLSNYYAITAGTWVWLSTYSIYLIQGVGITYSGKIQSLNADGFTVFWTKAGAKTGMSWIAYFAVR